LSKTSFLNLHAHFHLIGWVTILTIAFIMGWKIGVTIRSNLLIFLIVEVTFIAYGVGMFGMFFLYKLIDAVIYRKFKELF
jgi:hypothetical protein